MGNTCSSQNSTQVVETKKLTQPTEALNNIENIEVVQTSNNKPNDTPTDESANARSNVDVKDLKASSNVNASPVPAYKLTYFDLRGRGEIARLIFAAAGIDYIDNRIKLDEWSALKNSFPLKTLPILDIGDVRITQSLAIARYLAKEFGLDGKSSIEKAQVDVVVDTALELFLAFVEKIYPFFLRKDDEKLAEAIPKFIEEDISKGFSNLIKLFDLFKSNGYFVGNELTWGDLYVHEIVTNCLLIKADLLDNYQILKEHRLLVEKNEKIEAYLKKRKI